MEYINAPNASNTTQNHRYIVKAVHKFEDRSVLVDILLDGAHDHYKRANALVQRHLKGYMIPSRPDWFNEYVYMPF